MRAKRLEAILGTGLKIGEPEMVQRFQKLRDNRLLPTSRGRNAEDITTDEVVSGLLSVIDERPGFAGLTASILRSLRPVGTPADGFAKAATFGAALRAALDTNTLLNTVTEIRVSNSEIYTNCFGRGAIFYRDGSKERVSYYVGSTAISLLQPGKETDYDPRDLISSMIRETIIFPHILKIIMHEMQQTDAYDRATSGLPSVSNLPYIIVVDPAGPLGNEFLTLDQALDTARGLEQSGVRVRSINQGSDILEGTELRAALGENEMPAFVNLPRQ
jgi:hypothetical protein